MKQDFLTYIRETFCFSQEEMQAFEFALSQGLKKTLRVNTNKISLEDFQASLKKKSKSDIWTLSPTSLGKNMFSIDRSDTRIALGHTLEHIGGYIYIQELSASSSPYYLSGDVCDETEYMILDMSASPGGKTTQLAEYYPNALIVANEIDKSRMRQLHENTDRLSAHNVFVSNYDGRHFAQFPEIFDKILLDAPCSGEGTAYKNDDALKYWNIKNIRRIAKLQLQLLESALISLKVGGEIIYSTCTLNLLENEEIIQKILEKYPESVEYIALPETKNGDFGLRSWPHIQRSGGFFVSKLKKTGSIPTKTEKKLQKHTQGFEKVSKTDEKAIHTFLKDTFGLHLPGRFYSYRREIYYTQKNIDFIWENFFLYKCGIKIGSFENGVFSPNFLLGTHFGKFRKNTLALEEDQVDALLRGESIGLTKSPESQYVQILHKDLLAGIAKRKNSEIQSLLETRFLRK